MRLVECAQRIERIIEQPKKNENLMKNTHVHTLHKGRLDDECLSLVDGWPFFSKHVRISRTPQPARYAIHSLKKIFLSGRVSRETKRYPVTSNFLALAYLRHPSHSTYLFSLSLFLPVLDRVTSGVFPSLCRWWVKSRIKLPLEPTYKAGFSHPHTRQSSCNYTFEGVCLGVCSAMWLL